MIFASKKLNLKSGTVIAVPIPDNFVESNNIIEAIEQALQEAQEKFIKGRDATPFLLSRVKDLTKGKSLAANISLIKNNAKVAAQIARSLHFKSRKSSGEIVIFGGSVIDVTSKYSINATVDNQTSNPGTCFQMFGGAGRNVAEACFRSRRDGVKFVSVIGDDFFGEILESDIKSIGMDTSFIEKRLDNSTAVYNAILDKSGNLLTAVASMKIFEHIKFDPTVIDEKIIKMVVIDGNVSLDTMKEILQFCNNRKIPILYEPTSVFKSTKILQILNKLKIDFATPDYHEMMEMGNWALKKSNENYEQDLMKLTKEIHHLPIQVQKIIKKIGSRLVALLEYTPNIIIKIGKYGVLAVRLHQNIPLNIDYIIFKSESFNQKYISLKHFPSIQMVENPLSVTGAGDSLVGTFSAALSINYSFDQAIQLGLESANLSLQSHKSISENIKKII